MTGTRDEPSGILSDDPGKARSGVPDGNGSQIPDPGSRDAWDDMALVGRIARPHGLRGQVVVNPETDFVEERFAPGAHVWTRSPQGEVLLTVVSMRVQNGRPIVGFEGFERIEDVEGLGGQELRVPDIALQRLEPGTFYEHQLVGCLVKTVAGDVVGNVAKVEGGAGATRLAIDGPRGEILIPLAMDICVEIDVVNKRIRIEPPDGLLELNEKGPAKAGPHDRNALHVRRGRL